ncbi:MAG TPA: TetR/AcrR family transcriptional regulator [Terracidiphilus sp.]|nr:TetR/AcrR family transcriptional regulator [Terracidiphilus sp.]
MTKTSSAKTKNIYPAHRERQRRRILEAARALFDERGIDRATMAELTSASGIQPSTMYQYFSNKDDIVWDLLGELMEDGARRAKRVIAGAPNALAEIESLLGYMADELSNDPMKVRFMAQFDAMYARNWPAERLLTLESQIALKGFHSFKKLVRKGIADGSLRSDLDPDLTLIAVINAVVGAQRRLASLGNKVEMEYGQPIDRLFREIVRIILFGLRAPEPVPAVAASNGSTTKKRQTRRRSS